MANRNIYLFSDLDFSDVERNTMMAVEGQVAEESDDYLLNTNEEEYLDHLLSTFSIQPLEVDFDHAYATEEEHSIAAEAFPPMSIVTPGHAYRKQVFIFHFPFSGAVGLWRVRPNPTLAWAPMVELEEGVGTINLHIVQFWNSVDRVNQEYDAFVSRLKQQLASLAGNVGQFNASLKSGAKQILSKRKSLLKKQADDRAGLRVPVRRNTAPSTFAVPVKSPKRIVPKPAGVPEPYTIDPTLDSTIYAEIVQLVHDFGKQLERLPATYKGKNEETLRDHFLLVLQPHFGLEGSATGETFNTAGKTDILIRYQNHNLFVAEFKFWRGQKQHFATIDQLLSYLTWRDSKTAIVYFIDGKEVLAALKAIEETTPHHPAFVALKNKKEESWFSYELHLQDKEKTVQTAVLCFHLPD